MWVSTQLDEDVGCGHCCQYPFAISNEYINIIPYRLSEFDL